MTILSGYPAALDADNVPYVDTASLLTVDSTVVPPGLNLSHQGPFVLVDNDGVPYLAASGQAGWLLHLDADNVPYIDTAELQVTPAPPLGFRPFGMHIDD